MTRLSLLFMPLASLSHGAVTRNDDDDDGDGNCVSCYAVNPLECRGNYSATARPGPNVTAHPLTTSVPV